MKRETILIHGVTFALSPEGGVEVSMGGAPVRKSESVELMLMFFLLREMQALNGALREEQPKIRGASSQGIFPP